MQSMSSSHLSSSRSAGTGQGRDSCSRIETVFASVSVVREAAAPSQHRSVTISKRSAVLEPQLPQPPCSRRSIDGYGKKGTHIKRFLAIEEHLLGTRETSIRDRTHTDLVAIADAVSIA